MKYEDWIIRLNEEIYNENSQWFESELRRIRKEKRKLKIKRILNL